MKKVIGKILALALGVVTLSTSFKVSAKAATLDLSQFTDADIKNYMGVYDGFLYVYDDYPYYFLYTDDEDKYYYIHREYDEENETATETFEEYEDVNASIVNKDNYIDDGHSSYGWFNLGDVEYLDTLTPYSFYIFVYDDGFKNLGKYDSFSSLDDVCHIDSLFIAPKVELSVKYTTEKSATIVAKYTSDVDFRTVVLLSGNRVIEEKALTDTTSGTVEFTVDLSGTYNIGFCPGFYRAACDIYYTSDDVFVAIGTRQSGGTQNLTNIASIDTANGTAQVADPVAGGSSEVPLAVIIEGAVYRMYNPNSGEHFYTKSSAERDSLIDSGWNYEENASFSTIAADEDGAKPIYRVYNPNSGLHHYTMNHEEAIMLKSVGWNYEGISFYAFDTESGIGSPQYRVYNPNDGQHHWTVDANERDSLVSIGWNDEGIAWNVK